jgi:hypothetical protein
MTEGVSPGDETRIIHPGRVMLAHHELVARGPETHRIYNGQPQGATAEVFGGATIDELREWLNARELARPAGQTKQPPFPKPFTVSLTGALFPCGLLTPGWWQRRLARDHAHEPVWKSDVQRWHYIGFNEWAPSWDFSWHLDDWDRSSRGQATFYAQFGDGDEGDSLPVRLGVEDARKVRDELDNWGGMFARVTGLLGYRTQFPDYDRQLVKDPGGWLNYCLWIDEDKTGKMPRPGVERLSGRPGVYSGYMWKCLAPARWVEERALGPEDVFFAWVHTDFSRPDAVAFSRDELEAKVRQLERHVLARIGEGNFRLLAKSSHLLDGVPLWTGGDEVQSLLAMQRVPRRGPPAPGA